MKETEIVQFVCFETVLNEEEFIREWEQFTRSANSEEHVIIQQSEKNGKFFYIAQHRSASGEFNFSFNKARRSSKLPSVEIKAKTAGGYFLSYAQKTVNANSNEKKVFAFISEPRADLEVYKQMSAQAKLNIYEAYYENCQYASILEFFVPNKYVPALAEKLKQHMLTEVNIYKECAFHPA